ncbi:MAG TPA: apolipoprotein N-acyltransferase, partial [Acidobacteriaceae bacterium]|nr:apolipoprotein N-acyltransferase [Acidobacteriaceae bacterium]
MVAAPQPLPAQPLRASLRLPILLAFASSILLDFCFPVAGPLPPWRGILAWFALVPLLWALLAPPQAEHPRYLRRAAFIAWLSGLLWYILNCYWIYQTMHLYGNMPPIGAAGMVFAFSAILGLYFGLFGFLLALIRRRLGLTAALVAAPFLWTALELAAARITSVPWDQLGYAQVDNLFLTHLAPWTGVYGLSFVLMGANALFAGAMLSAARTRLICTVSGILLVTILQPGSFVAAPSSPTSAYAVLLQPNINVAAEDATTWPGLQWNGQLSWILLHDARTCTPAFTGLPTLAHPPAPPPDCAQNIPPPGMILWPETASWFQSDQPRTLDALRTIATAARAPVIAGMLGHDARGFYNSGVFANSDGSVQGRYDKIHLVPFGEYIPYRQLFFFAPKLTHQLEDLHPGTERVVFRADGHTFGTFICYESVFADEIRHFALNGAEVLVNISDDGWYGDTSAPWQHLNMTRMRAIENHRWLLLDTNSGVTTAIDPSGRVTLSIPRHTLTSLAARYGYRSDLTFYTRHGD